MLDDMESQWSRELRADVEIRSLGRDYEVRIDGDQFATGSLEDLDKKLFLLTLFTEVERDGF
jgi:hypothetical protein